MRLMTWRALPICPCQSGGKTKRLAWCSVPCHECRPGPGVIENNVSTDVGSTKIVTTQSLIVRLAMNHIRRTGNGTCVTFDRSIGNHVVRASVEAFALKVSHAASSFETLFDLWTPTYVL